MYYQPTTNSASINISSSGDNTVIAAQTGKSIIVHQLFLVCSGAVSLKFKDGASTDLCPAMPMLTSGSIVLEMREPWFQTTAGNAFIINLSSAVQVGGRIYYTVI